MRVKYIFSAKLSQKSRKSPTTNKHKVAFTKQAQQVIQKADIILEILDARFVEKTRNLELEKIAKAHDKKIIFILNKADLVDVNELKLNYDLKSIEPYVLFSTKNKIGRARLKKLLSIESKRVKFPKVKIGIVGYPNTGKSSIINVLVGGRRAATSSQAGSTKNIQEIKFKKNILILDSPGVILNEEYEPTNINAEKKRTEIGARDYHKVKYPDLIVNEIAKQNPSLLDDFYKIKSKNDAEILIEKLGRKLNFLKRGGEVDSDRTARQILKDWQEGKIVQKIKAKSS